MVLFSIYHKNHILQLSINYAKIISQDYIIYEEGAIMAKQQIVEFENGATLVYQKQEAFNGYSFIIGFRGGAQLDGKHTGLSHLLEHLLFRSPKEDLTRNILDNILRYSIDQNAFTSEDMICVDFSAVDKNVGIALENCMNMITNRDFTTEQISQEIAVVKQEINLEIDRIKRTPITSMLQFMNAISESEYIPTGLDILGTPKTLSTVTPELLSRYVERYFNTNNMVISVTSNKPLERVVELLNEKVFSRIQPATDERYIIDFPEPEFFKPVNMLVAIPNPTMTNVKVNLLLRERSDFSEDANKEYAYDVIEEYLMNTIGGLLWDQLRVHNNLVYSFGLHNLDLGSVKFKSFQAVTSPGKMRKTIAATCKMIREIGENGVPKDKFEVVKAALVDQHNAVLQKFKSCSAMANFESLMSGEEFLDYKAVMNHIKNMTYEDFNARITETYRTANVSLLVDGGFESKNVYSLLEVERMLGNTTHEPLRDQFNAPRAEATPLAPQKPLVVEVPTVVTPTEEGMPPAVDIDDEMI